MFVETGVEQFGHTRFDRVRQAPRDGDTGSSGPWTPWHGPAIARSGRKVKRQLLVDKFAMQPRCGGRRAVAMA
jgi:hypothetical protein